MVRGLIGHFVAFVALLAAGVSAAQDGTPPALTIDEVLASSEQHYPRILEALAVQRAASGRALEADGSFDLVFSGGGFSRVGGYYDGTAVEGVAKQPLPSFGSTLYAGYKLSDGEFPIYEDEYYTNTGGAFKVGVLFSLLRDRTFDDRRFRQRDAAIEMRQAELDILLTKIGVQEQATIAYWRWVTAGRQLKVYENLLRISLDRQDALDEQVRRGARAQIFLTENLQNITRRQTLVISARRTLNRAANTLSLYYRSAEGQPRIADAARLPPGATINEIYSIATPAGTAINQALERRPELALLKAAIEREQNRVRLTENNLKPRLDLNMEVQQGLGSIAEGGPSRDSTDTIVGFTFSVPLQRREGQGRLERSAAEIDAKRQQQRLREEQIEIEVRNLLVDLNVTRELLLLAAQEVQQSEILRASELRRFQSGASDFFLLNVREETAADARIKQLQAELELRIARANYDAATVNTDELGISTEYLGP